MYNDVKLEKGLYNLSGKSFTSALEELDPSAAYVGTELAALEKIGRLINASYEAIRKQRLDVFGVMLRSIGIKLANTVVSKAITVLKTGATGVTTSSLSYSDLADLYGSFAVCELCDFIREEQRFSSFDDLTAQIKKDCDRIKTILS